MKGRTTRKRGNQKQKAEKKTSFTGIHLYVPVKVRIQGNLYIYFSSCEGNSITAYGKLAVVTFFVSLGYIVT